MPIPATAAPSEAIHLHALIGSRWDVRCGKCMATSAPTPAGDAAGAWLALRGLGWIHYVSPYGGVGYAVCPECARSTATTPGTRKARKRR